MLNISSNEQPKEILLADYSSYPFSIDTTSLIFDLDATQTVVTAQLAVRRLIASAKDMVLDGGPHMDLLSVSIDGKTLDCDQYKVTDDQLTVLDVGDAFTLDIVTKVNPQANTRLEGLYQSSSIFCTQCEAEGFRHITYFPDRPDVLSVFDVKVIADKKSCPVLLSNGNPVDAGDCDNGKHFAYWEDPHPKPSYLFALVAGDLGCLSSQFITAEGRKVALNIYALPKDLDKCDYAMGALKRSMIWDQDKFGLNYDLDVYNIVAVSDFNMGAMENKGLNVFNTKYVLATPETATDQDFSHVEAVIGHEYFHNWTGNRVTCRDWFQLSLKEGLTVYRDQEFSSDMRSRVIKRIDDVKVLRAAQFPEDAGPFAHPVRPEKYIEINNFYTATIYNKGAEVIRMMATLIGRSAFRKGMDLYFERHDGSAVTCEDFVCAMEDASGYDLRQFRLWYSQAGTPSVTIKEKDSANADEIQFEVSQKIPSTPGQNNKEPMVIPITMGFVTDNGDCQNVKAVSDNIRVVGDGRFILLLSKAKETFKFSSYEEASIPSFLREFSAPINLDVPYSKGQQYHLLKHDQDAFNRVEMSEKLFAEEIVRLSKDCRTGNKMQMSRELIAILGAMLDQYTSDPALTSALIALPTESDVSNRLTKIDIEAIFQARKFMMEKIARGQRRKLNEVYQACQQEISSLEGGADDARASNYRRLKNVCLTYLGSLNGRAENILIVDQLENSKTMTDRIAALQIVVNSSIGSRVKLINQFYREWKDEDLVVDKWFMVQATSRRADVLSRVVKLLSHPAFTLSNPNRVRALIGSFTMGNTRYFHDESGAGYDLLSGVIQKLDKINPQVAARMLTPLGRYQKFDDLRKGLMATALKSILDSKEVSKPVFEIAKTAVDGLSPKDH